MLLHVHPAAAASAKSFLDVVTAVQSLRLINNRELGKMLQDVTSLHPCPCIWRKEIQGMCSESQRVSHPDFVVFTGDTSTSD